MGAAISRCFATGFLAALVCGLAGGAFPNSAAAQQGEASLTCTNPASGASWQITIDYRRPAVDGNQAQIGASRISWFDPKDGGNYTLDRTSGALTAVVASSTGGYFRYARCTLEAVR